METYGALSLDDHFFLNFISNSKAVFPSGLRTIKASNLLSALLLNQLAILFADKNLILICLTVNIIIFDLKIDSFVK